MDLTNYAVAASLLTFFVIGAVELVKQAFASNWKSVAIILVSGLVGALGGFALPVIGIIAGLALGLSASGLVTTLQKVGEGTASVPLVEPAPLPAHNIPFISWSEPQSTPVPPVAPYVAPAVDVPVQYLVTPTPIVAQPVAPAPAPVTQVSTPPTI